MTQSYGFELRKLFLVNQIDFIIDFNSIQIFEASVDTQISLSRKYDVKGDYFFKVITYQAGDSLLPLKSFNTISTKTIKLDDKLYFKLELNERTIKILDSIYAKSYLLEEICYVSVGAICHSDKPKKIPKAHFIHNKQHLTKCLKPYIEGKDIVKWKIASSKYLDYQPKLFNQGAGFPELFTTPKIVNKRTCGRRTIEFTYDEKGYYTNEKVNNVGSSPI